MNLRKLAPLGPCDRCGRIRRCRPVEADRYECLECTPAGHGAGELDELYNSDQTHTKRIVSDGGIRADQGGRSE
jgi:hypothetical protein